MKTRNIKYKKNLRIFLISIFFSSSILANNNYNNFETSAKIENFYTIKASDVNFGVVNLPLTAQSANSQMRVLCSNNTPYKIDLIYGQYIDENINASGYTISYDNSTSFSYYNVYNIYDPTGKKFGTLYCGLGLTTGEVRFNSTKTANFYGYTILTSQPDTNKICQSDGTRTGTYPTGWAGAYNLGGQQNIADSNTAEIGSMNGSQKGDKLAYKITLPQDSSKTWTKGLNTYNATGVGAEQIININAQIVPDKSSSKYIAQDVYLDNITAEVSY